MKTTEKVFKFKATFLNGLILKMIALSLIISVLMFAVLNIDYSLVFFFSMLIVFCGVLLVFYLNRYDVEIIKITDKNIDIEYFNKSFFKQKRLLISRNDIDIEEKDNGILLLKDLATIGVIREKSLIAEDWDEFIHALAGGQRI